VGRTVRIELGTGDSWVFELKLVKFVVNEMAAVAEVVVGV
jgi:hypothetical protein